jgi:hypothetical protein
MRLVRTLRVLNGILFATLVVSYIATSRFAIQDNWTGLGVLILVVAPVLAVLAVVASFRLRRLQSVLIAIPIALFICLIALGWQLDLVPQY